jgi:hypothetical protein
MDSADTVSPARPDRRQSPALHRVRWLLLLVALAGYGILIARHVGAYAGGSDSSGYMNHARLLGEGHVHSLPRVLPELPASETPEGLYTALGFRQAPDGHGVVPTYPTGLPLFILLAAKLVGWRNAGNVVLWLHAMAGVLVTYAAGRTFGLSRRSAMLAMVMIAACPVYLFIAVQAMSDVPALVWTTAAIVCAWRSRTKRSFAFAAGAAYAIAVLIRPTDALALLPIAIAFALDWKNWLAFGAAGLPGAIFFCLHSHAAYGKLFTTGYGDSAGLESKWIGLTLAHYGRWLPVVLSPLVIWVLGLPAIVTRHGRVVWLLLAWIAIFAGFYSAYSCTHETWWYLRFLLPAAPALAIGALLVLQTLFRPSIAPKTATLLACCGLLFVYSWEVHWTRKLGALDAGEGERTYPLVADWLNEHLPHNAALAVMQHSGAVYYSTNFIFIRWDGLKPDRFRRIASALERSGRPLYAVLSPFEIEEQHALTEHLATGHWTRVGAVREVTIWKWEPSAAPQS